VPWSKHTQHGRAGQCRNGGALVAYFYHATPPLGLRELPEGRQRMLENGKLKQRPTLVAFWIILEFGILLILANDQIDRIMLLILANDQIDRIMFFSWLMEVLNDSNH